ncbi:MAG TPA: hypothetical protein PKH24_13585 [Sedimentisphaerales bacterium]|jgi:hypothetical protein|nr:hypothetical protein [Sedimentisphaerales bacterium]HNU29883.1 hypothetical protein [Sedimentisphaerales bacterium]
MDRVVIAILCVLAWASCLQAAGPEFNVDFTCGWNGYYRPMEWTPVEVALSSDLKEPFAGSVSLTAQQDGLNTLTVSQAFVLMPDVSLPISFVTKFAFGASACDVTIRDDRGRVRDRIVRNLWDYSPQQRMLHAVQEQDLLLGLVGSTSFGLMRLPKETACTSARGPGQVFVGPKLARNVPWDWTGFAGLDLLILSDPDWSLLKPQQVRAICEWVSNGGALLLVLGRHPLPQDSPLREAIPFLIGEPRQVEIPPDAMDEWGLDSSRSQTVTGWPLSLKPGMPMAGRVESQTVPLCGTGPVGFGRVAVVAFDPTQFGDSQVGRTAAFWTKQIVACLGGGSNRGAGPTSSAVREVVGAAGRGRTLVLAGDVSEADRESAASQFVNRHRIGIAQSAANQVMNYLFELRQMQPLSIWWVILTLTLLAVLLGPVDYWVLKRLDRQPLTWLTSTGWIALFTFGAYYGVQYLRAGSMELRAVTVFDGIADANCAWASCYAGVFAPRSDEYRLDGLTPHQWWSGAAPMQEEIWAHQRESGMRQIYCRQADGGNLPTSIPISIWTVQSLLCEWTPKEMPFAATIDRSGAVPAVEIRNLSDSRIRLGYVLFKDSCADLGPVAARSTQRFPIRTRAFQLRLSQDLPSGDGRGGAPPNVRMPVELPRLPVSLTGAADNAFFAQGCLNRTVGMYCCLDSGSAIVCVVFEDPPTPFTIRSRSYAVNHIQFARLLVPAAKSEGGIHD